MSTAPSGFQTPKTNWQPADVVQPSDLNRIEGNINAIEAGTRTVDPSQAPSSNQGTLRQLLDWFANRIRAITGAANWYDAPPATLSGLNTSLANHKSASPIDHPDGSVTAAKIASGAVTAAKIVSGAVTSDKLAAGAVTAGKLADSAVDTINRIASGIRTTPGGTEANRIAVTDGSGAVGLARQAVLSRTGPTLASVRPGWWCLPGWAFKGHTQRNISSGWLIYVPILVREPTAFDRIGVHVDTKATDQFVRLGIYTADDSGAPDKLLLDAGRVSLGLVGEQSIRITRTLDPGLYWLAYVSDSSWTSGTGVDPNGVFACPATSGWSGTIAESPGVILYQTGRSSLVSSGLPSTAVAPRSDAMLSVDYAIVRLRKV